MMAGFPPMRTTTIAIIILVSAIIVSCLVDSVDGFAYAPNFITKIIQEDTGIQPPSSDATIALLEAENSVVASATAVAVADGEGQQTDKKQPPVITRFPPEPNGYLHLGHAKAVSFNFAVARMFGGVCHMRLDDTNPSKEDEEYVQSILEDVRWIQSGILSQVPEEGDKESEHTTTNSAHVPWSGPVRKTSDYFDLIYDCAEALIRQGDAYVDSLSAEEMREYRGTLTEPGKDSPYRNRSIEENLELFQKVSNITKQP
jgi:tRNA synthetases class I (E and Q), catalytic domain